MRQQALEAREAKGLGQAAQQLIDRARELQSRLDLAKKDLRNRPEREQVTAASEAAREAGTLLGALDEHRLSLEPKPVQTSAIDPNAIKIGDHVWVDRLRSVADVIEGPARGKVRVAAGMMKLWVDVTDLRALERVAEARVQEPAAASGAHPKVPRAVRTSDNTLDVRGLRAEEAVALTEAFLDRMYGAAEPNAYIVHGVGSGALRDAIRELLSRDDTYVEEIGARGSLRSARCGPCEASPPTAKRPTRCRA